MAQRPADADAPEFGKIVSPSSRWAEIVADGVDWDVPDADTGRIAAAKAFPSTGVYFILQYRVPVWSSRRYGTAVHPHGNRRHMATRVQSGIVTAWGDGPVGAVILRLRPEAAVRLLGQHLQDFADTKIGLGDIFGDRKIALLEERIAEAPCRAARFAHMLGFLADNMLEREPDALVCRAATLLRRRPALRVSRVAAALGMSERSLSRKFQAMFGMSPKHFARTARVEKALMARRGGASWADVAHACGFADQAHMIRDFNDILGASPEQAMRPTVAAAA